ncbi:hypothetical protein AN958_00715 [Leucoagaricus sp. SymC.cos]|nr:hypothetical protein AN958_00715 [Leucoagaricus sp. SymC.cos]
MRPTNFHIRTVSVGDDRRVMLLLPTPFDEKIKENKVMDRTRKWLRKTYPQRAFVDHIICFPAKTTDQYRIKPISAIHLPDLQRLLKTDDGTALYRKISLIRSAGEQTPGEWDYFREQGVAEHEFDRTRPGAVRGIIGDIVPGRRGSG